jgi:hypothetical protein
MAATDQPAVDRDAELTQLARDLEYTADLWRRRGLLGLADQLHTAAEYSRGWVGADEGGDAA